MKKENCRDILAPYKHQRLRFEGVLIDIIEPNIRNDYTYGLIFGSVYNKEHHLEIDHVVIKIANHIYNKTSFEFFKRYSFTAKIDTYTKIENILSINVIKTHYMLTDINLKKYKEQPISDTIQPTIYIQNRINNVLQAKKKLPFAYTRQELLDIIELLPNDGTVEQFICIYGQKYQQRKINKTQAINALYKSK